MKRLKLREHAFETGVLPFIFDENGEPPKAETAPSPARKEPPSIRVKVETDPDGDELRELEEKFRAAAQFSNASVFLGERTVRCYDEGTYHYLKAVGTNLFEVRPAGERRWHYGTSYDIDVLYDRSIGGITLHGLHVSRKGNVYAFTFRMELQKKSDDWFFVEKITVDKPSSPRKILPGAFLLQKSEEITEILDREKPYISSFLRENGYNVARWTWAPMMETLAKAGYAFAQQFLDSNSARLEHRELERLNRLVQPGTKPKAIFKTSKTIYSALKDVPHLREWDILRKMDKQGKVNADTVALLRDGRYAYSEIEEISSILGKKYDGRAVFTWESLMNYLGRLDMYEAIDTRQAIVLLGDYLNMCSQLGMEPRIDGDSLKREHDIAARLVRERRNKIHEEAMRKRAEELKRAIDEGHSKLARADYKENVYFIKRITAYDDLADEAAQQHNCVLSYAPAIAEGRSIILTMRETAHPEKSLVTVELSPDCRTIRQKFLAYNQPIRNKSISDFLDRWLHQLNAPAPARAEAA